MEDPPFSISDRVGAGLVLGGGYLPDLVKGAFFLVGTGSRSGSDSDIDSDPVHSEFGGIDFCESDSNSSISYGGSFFGPLQMEVEGIGLWEVGGVLALSESVVKRSSALNPEPGKGLLLNPLPCTYIDNKSLWLG